MFAIRIEDRRPAPTHGGPACEKADTLPHFDQEQLVRFAFQRF